MTEVWNEKKHDIRIEEKTDMSLTYIAEIICDEKVVYHMEQPYTSRFSLMKIHNEFLQKAEAFKKEGILPSHRDILKKSR